jgi:hypothetical protein
MKQRLMYPKSYAVVTVVERDVTRSGLATVTQIGRRLTRVGKAPALGVEVTYRLYKSTGCGRVIQSTGNTALVIPYQQDSDGPVCLHVLRRPHSSAPWKAYKTSLGHYRNDALVWPIIEAKVGLLPLVWRQAYASASHTLARLIEARARLASIGLITYGTTLPEEKAALALSYNSVVDQRDLARFRSTTERERATGDQDVANYMEAVLAYDEATFDAAELIVTKAEVGSWMRWWTDTQRDKLRRQGCVDVGEIPLATLLGEMHAAPGIHRASIIAIARESILSRLARVRTDPRGVLDEVRAEQARLNIAITTSK